MGDYHTAGTGTSRQAVAQPHRFDADDPEWGRRPCCRVCGEERGDVLHTLRKAA
jgi:hypothetical protein